MQRLLGPCPEALSVWFASPNKNHAGLDQLGLGSARLQTTGFRQVVTLPWGVLERHVQILKTQFQDEGKNEVDKMKDIWEMLKSADKDFFSLDSLLPACRVATVGPGEVLVCPTGTVFLERTLGSTAGGLRSTFMNAGVESEASFSSINKHRDKPNSLATAILQSLGS